MEIKKIPFWSLQKLELPAIARTVIEIIEDHNPEELQISKSLDLLVAQMPNIDLLKPPYGAHVLTEDVANAHSKCILYGQLIVYKMGVVVKAQSKKPTRATKKANLLVKKYLYQLALSKNYTIVHEKVDGFLKDIKSDIEASSAFTEFEFTQDLNNLQMALIEVKELLLERDTMISERSKLKTADLEKPIQKAMKDIFKHIEVAALTNTELDYAPLINLLNQTIVGVQNAVNSRLLYNKRKAEESKQLESNNEAVNPIDLPTPMIQSLNVERAVGNDSVIKLDKQFDENKTVASSSKQTQLPNLNKED